jgi:3D (Asp-Asp-Asp) domain-containing protein
MLCLIIFIAGLQLGIRHGRMLEALDARMQALQSEASGDSATKDQAFLNPETPAPCHVTIYAYAPVRRCTDKTPHITASNQIVRPGIIAVSRDVERDLDMQFGDKVHIYGLGTFEFQDRMHKRYTRSVDVLLPTVKQCKKFGVKSGRLAVIKQPSTDLVAAQ